MRQKSVGRRQWIIFESKVVNWVRSLRQMHKAIRRKNRLINSLRDQINNLELEVMLYRDMLGVPVSSKVDTKKPI